MRLVRWLAAPRKTSGAEIQTYPGWGHDFPSQLVPTLVNRIAAFCKAAQGATV